VPEQSLLRMCATWGPAILPSCSVPFLMTALSIRRNERYPPAYSQQLAAMNVQCPSLDPSSPRGQQVKVRERTGINLRTTQVSSQSCAEEETADCSISLCQQPHLVFALRTCGATPPHRTRFSTGPSNCGMYSRIHRTENSRVTSAGRQNGYEFRNIRM
jgi:hypothetical protein